MAIRFSLGYNANVQRFSVTLLACLTALSLLLAPWAAINRSSSAESSVLLLPNRYVDFTGRTDALPVGGLNLTLIIVIVCVAVILLGTFLTKQLRSLLWIVAGIVLIITTALSTSSITRVSNNARIALVVESLQGSLENPREGTDLERLQQIIDEAPNRAVDETVLEARQAGVDVRRLNRLPYGNAGIGLTAFLCYVTGIIALMLGLRMFDALDDIIDRIFATAAVPLSSILLALVAAAIVILSLQGTPVDEAVTLSGFQYLVGRLDTLWYSYYTLFADSLTTFPGILQSLTFATPLIFTGLAVAFGFQAGLFNIGAPGQIALGAIVSVLVGIYMPGPRILVLPLAVLAAAVGGGLWGAIPGFLKARFGASEVINTILLNYVATSILLFILSSSSIFSAAALRVMMVLAVIAVIAIILSLIAPVRKLFGRSSRISLAFVGVIVLVACFIAGSPRPGDAPVVVQMPFKVPGSEPKTAEIREEARLFQLPALLGVPAGTPGTVILPVNYAPFFAIIAGVVALLLLPRISDRLKGWLPRIIAALVVAGVVFGISLALGWGNVRTPIPPTRLNASFLIAIAAAVFVYYFLWKTKWGYELRAVGLAPKAAEYGGANIARNTVLTMTISGALAGLTACHYVLGGTLEDFSLRQAIPLSDGFDGIAVALLGSNTPLGVVLSAFLFGVLKNGGVVLNLTFNDLNRYVVSMILALVVLFIAAKGFLPEWLTNPLKRIAAQEEKAQAKQEATPAKKVTS
jgi:general nucleoside transport system permease protein